MQLISYCVVQDITTQTDGDSSCKYYDWCSFTDTNIHAGYTVHSTHDWAHFKNI